MKRRQHRFVLFLFGWFIVGNLGNRAVAALDPGLFGPTFRAQMEKASKLPQDQRARAAELEYVFVGGIIGEYLAPLGYFSDVRRELASAGVPYEQTHLLVPSSARSVEENAQWLEGEMARIAATTDRKIVVVAYSKGGPEFLGFALANPEFVEDRAEAVIFLQGAFGGSPLADYLRRVPLPAWTATYPIRAGMFFIRRLGRTAHALIRGVESLTTEVSRRRIDRWRDEYAAAIPRIEGKILYVQTWTEPARATIRLRVAAGFMRALDMKSDGTVPLDAQRAYGIGSHFTILEDVDHSLPCSRALAWRAPTRARAFARALMSSVGR